MTNPYTQEQAEEDIATNRGLIDKLSEVIALNDSFVPNTPASGSDLFSLLGVLQHLGSSGMTGALPITQTDTTSTTVTQASTTLLSGQFPVPANDANPGTTYRLTCSGNGQQGSTLQQLTLIQQIGGTNVNQINIAGTGNGALAASDPFDWFLQHEATITATGSSGTMRVVLIVAISKNNAAANNGNNIVGVRQSGGVAIDTTVSRNFQLNALWAATTGAPTITCTRTTFERVGP